jgi:diacylglycerol kinase family enzyme
MRATVVHNPTAGDGNLSTEELLAALRAAGLEPWPIDATSKAALADGLRRPTDLVVAGGGDGTLAKVIKTLPDRRVPILPLPLGTANNIARTFAIEADACALIAGWATAARRPLAIGTATGPWGRQTFVEGLGVGAIAAAMQALEADDAPSAERAERAARIIRDTLAAARPEPLHLTVDGEEVAVSALQAQVLNIAFASSGLPLAPHADPGDELLDVVVIEEAQREAMLRWLDDERRPEEPPVTVRRGRKVGFAWRHAPLHLDDGFPEPPLEPSPVELTLEGDPVILLVPERKAT